MSQGQCGGNGEAEGYNVRNWGLAGGGGGARAMWGTGAGHVQLSTERGQGCRCGAPKKNRGATSGGSSGWLRGAQVTLTAGGGAKGGQGG